MAEKNLEQQVKELQEANINLRFNTVEKQLSKIEQLLEQYLIKAEENHTIALKNIEDTKNRVTVLEEKNRNCPVSTYKGELKRFGIETKFVRYLFKKPIIGVAILTVWVILIVFVLVAFDIEPIIKLLTFFK